MVSLAQNMHFYAIAKFPPVARSCALVVQIKTYYNLRRFLSSLLPCAGAVGRHRRVCCRRTATAHFTKPQCRCFFKFRKYLPHNAVEAAVLSCALRSLQNLVACTASSAPREGEMILLKTCACLQALCSFAAALLVQYQGIRCTFLPVAILPQMCSKKAENAPQSGRAVGAQSFRPQTAA